MLGRRELEQARKKLATGGKVGQRAQIWDGIGVELVKEQNDMRDGTYGQMALGLRAQNLMGPHAYQRLLFT